MKFKSLLILLVFIQFNLITSFAQKQSGIWYFGDHAGVNFLTNPPTALTDGAMNTDEGSSTMCDPDGNLLFYTDGITVWNKEHSVMLNGEGLLGSPTSTQSGTIIPIPEHPDKYFIFTISEQGGGAGLCYSEVDMTLDGGLGGITEKNYFLKKPVCEKITAVKHANGIDIWVIIHEYGNNTFYAGLNTADGLRTTLITSKTGLNHTGQGYNGYLKASPNGNKIASVLYYEDAVEIFNFDNSTGIISNAQRLAYPGSRPYGVEFSPDGSKLYVTSYESGAGAIYQYDLSQSTITNINKSVVKIGVPTTTYRFAIQLGSDRKIYVDRVSYPYLGVINNPNAKGTACNYVDNGVNLKGRNCQQGLPTFIQTYFYYDFSYKTPCAGGNTTFFFPSTTNIKSVNWNFGDPASGGNNTSDQLTSNHLYSKAGDYIVGAYVSYTDKRKDTTFYKSVSIQPLPKVNLGNDTIICGGINLKLLAGDGYSSYVWSESGNIYPYLIVNKTGKYSVTVSDNYGCQGSDEINVQFSPKITFSSQSKTDITCFGNKDGKVNVVATGGIGSFNYSIDKINYFSSGTISGLSKGTYVVNAKDQLGCSANSANLIISEPIVLKITSVKTTDVSCNNLSNGKIEIKATGGKGRLLYSLNSGSFKDSSQFNNLAEGTYTVTVKDTNSCQLVSDPIQIKNPQALNFETLSQNISCKGRKDGSIQINASGGTGTILYTINQVDYYTQSLFSNLASGNYTVTVKDSNQCPVKTTTLRISEPDSVKILGIIKQNITCNNSNDGTISVNAKGGTGKILYQLNNNNFTEIPTFSGLKEAKYKVTVKDINSCTAATSDTISIKNPSLISILKITSKNVSCYQRNDGEILFYAIGGTGRLSYGLNGSFSSDSLQTNLGAGTYKVSVKDQNGCLANGDSIKIIAPASISIDTILVSSLKCAESTDGKIEIKAHGGVSPLSYSLDKIDYKTSAVFENLLKGQYTGYIKDLNGCLFQTKIIDIKSNDKLAITNQKVTDISCNSMNDGKILVEATGGTGKLKYKLNSGTLKDSAYFTNLKQGDYIVTVVDENNCSIKSEKYVINNPKKFYISSETSSNITCHNINDGKITVVASGGTGILKYSLDTLNYTETPGFKDLAEGLYTVTVKDINGCKATGTEHKIINPPSIKIVSLDTIDNVICSEERHARINIKASGGTDTLRYSIDGGKNYQLSPLFTNLPGGKYHIIVKDTKACTAQDTNFVFNIKPIEFTVFEVKDATCHDFTDGSIKVEAKGGFGGLDYQFNEGEFGLKTEFAGLKPLTYSITVRDIAGCKIKKAVIIKNPDDIKLVKATVNTVSCHDDLDGRIVLEASGGVGKLRYKLNEGNYFESGIFENLAGGSYDAFIKDQNNCYLKDSIRLKVINPDILGVDSLIINNISCHGDKDGSLIIIPKGGTGIITSTLNNQLITVRDTFFNLNSGKYLLRMKDQNGCSFSMKDSVFISEQLKLFINSVTISPLSCYNSKDGKIEILASGGSGLKTYYINDTILSTSNNFKNLQAGIYNIKVKDINGCIAIRSSSDTLVNPPQIIVSKIQSFDASCSNSNDGKIAINAKGGRGVLYYVLNDTLVQKSGLFNKLNPERYVVKIKDDKGCFIKTDLIIIRNPYQLGISEVSIKDNIVCAGDSLASIKITSFGGTGRILFSIDSLRTFSNDSSFLKLPGGNYYVAVKDINNCISKIKPVQIFPLPIVVDSFLIKDITCSKQQNGEVRIFAKGGSGKLNYSIDQKNFQDTSVFKNLTGGFYKIKVRDTRNCIYSGKQFIIFDPNPIQLSFVKVKNISCYNQNDGSVTTRIKGGKAPYSFIWNNEKITRDTVANNLIPNSLYKLRVFDALGCTTDTSILLTQPDKLVAKIIDKTNINCNGEITGTAKIRVNGGVLPYSIYWNNVIISDSIINNLKGDLNYILKVNDSNNCQSIDSVVIYQPLPIIVNFAIERQIQCFGDQNGIVKAYVDGGILPYTYKWDDENNSALSIADKLRGDKLYRLIITDANSCKKMDSIILVQPKELIAKVKLTKEISCFGKSDGAANVSVTGGVMPYIYKWNDNLGSNDDSISGLSNQFYKILVNDIKGCYTEDSIFIIQPPRITILSEKTNDITCHNEKGEIIVKATGGKGILKYKLNNGIAQQTGEFIELTEGSYTITISDDNNCELKSSQVYQFKNPSEIKIDSLDVTELKCYGDTTGMIVVKASGGRSPLTYILNGLSGNNYGKFINLSGGTYKLEIIDTSQCIKTKMIELSEVLPIKITSEIKKSCNGLPDGEAKITVDGAIGNYSLIFSRSNGEILKELKELIPGSYQIQVIDANGCKLDDSVKIEQETCELKMTIYNVITPNSDQWNQSFKIINPENVARAHGIIMNRWGKKIYEWNGVEGGWDGKINNRKASSGVYFYLIDAVGVDTKHYKKEGFFYLYR